HFATEHTEVVLEPDVRTTLPRLAEAYDEPHGDDAALPLFLICEAARSEVTVALTGDGGDESFGGYERYLAHRLAARLPSAAAGLDARARRRISREPRSAATRAARFLETVAAPPADRYGRLMEVFPADLRAELWEPDFVSHPRSASELLGAPDGPG